MSAYRPTDLAKQWGCSERALRKLARDIGACRILGKAMWLTDDDVRAIEEAVRFRPAESSATMRGAASLPLPAGDYEILRASRDTKRRRGRGGHGQGG